MNRSETELEKKLEAALTREPEFKLPPHFAIKLADAIEAKQRKQSHSEHYWIALAAILLLTSMGVAIFLTGYSPDFKPTFGVFTFLKEYSGLVVFGCAFVALLNWVSNSFLSKKEADMGL